MPMDTFRDVIADFGGAAKMAEALAHPDITDGLVRQWKNRDSIPPGYWTLIIEKARDARIAGVTLGALSQLAAKRKAA